MQKVGRGKWDETNGVRKVGSEKRSEKSGSEESGTRKVGREKWGE